MCKVKIKEACIKYSKDKSRKARARHTTDKLRLGYLLRHIDQTGITSDTLTGEINQIQTRLNEDMLQKARGAQIRSRARWVEEGEKSTKYFLGLEKSNQTKKVITQLQDNYGNIVSDLDKVLQHQVDFYKTLYTSKNGNVNFIEEYHNSTVMERTVNEKERAKCEGALQVEECTTAVKNLKRNKAPSQDGLSAEFYQLLWPEIQDVVVASLNEGYQTGELSVSQRRAV